MKRHHSVEAYIQHHPQWAEALALLRKLVLSTPVEETVKWGGPVYTVNGKNVVGLGAFKSYVALWFYQGALLRDAHHKLINAQENVTKALRQWRFGSVEEIRADADTIRAYLLEAIENQRQGRVIKPVRDKALVLPPELADRLAADTSLRDRFEALSKGKKREYAEYIAGAKRP